MTPEDARALADDASQTIRALNLATLPADGCPGLVHPTDAFDVIGALAELARRLPQLLEQVSAFLQRQLQFDLVAVDDGDFAGDPLGAIGTAAHALEHDGRARTPSALQLHSPAPSRQSRLPV
ncbi:MAG: hypothetical protein JWP39_3460 [Jatrophihabitans sp.]|nr:hypothetical protein [Jatrophihabitans sp.]